MQIDHITLSKGTLTVACGGVFVQRGYEMLVGGVTIKVEQKVLEKWQKMFQGVAAWGRGAPSSSYKPC